MGMGVGVGAVVVILVLLSSLEHERELRSSCGGEGEEEGKLGSKLGERSRVGGGIERMQLTRVRLYQHCSKSEQSC